MHSTRVVVAESLSALLSALQKQLGMLNPQVNDSKGATAFLVVIVVVVVVVVVVAAAIEGLMS